MLTKKHLRRNWIIKVFMDYWYEFLLGSWGLFISGFFSHWFDNLPGVVYAILVLVTIILGMGLARIAYINYKDARIKKQIIDIRDNMLGVCLAVIVIMVISYISGLLTKLLVLVINDFFSFKIPLLIQISIAVIMIFPMLYSYDSIKTKFSKRVRGS